ncbi:hypothetical protein DUK53_14890 [Listeria sp. SHR_NRA_18]|nr:hypothetical protein DUK53_14890 [Listeria sp. SHR_NRA_18]
MKKMYWIILIFLVVIAVISAIFYFTGNNETSSREMENIQTGMTVDQVIDELGQPYEKIEESNGIKNSIESLKDDPLSKYVTDDIDELLFNFENSSKSEVFIYKAKNNDEDYKLFFIDNKLAYF